jgi:hypothetical protein
MGISRYIWDNVKDGLLLGPTFPLRHISGLLRLKYHVTTIKGAGTVRIRPKSSDAATFVQVFRNKESNLSGRAQFSRVMAAYQSILKGTSLNFQKVIAKRNFEILISGENLIYIRLPGQGACPSTS